MILADPQFGMAVYLRKKHEGAAEPPGLGIAVAPPGTPDSGWPYETARLERAVAVANDLNPDFVVVLGVVCSIGWTMIWQLRRIIGLLEGMQ